MNKEECMIGLKLLENKLTTLQPSTLRRETRCNRCYSVTGKHDKLKQMFI